MSELTGSLIEMNAHVVMIDSASKMLVFGAFVTVVFAVVLMAILTDRDKTGRAARVWVCACLVAIGVAMAIAGVTIPRVKEIRYCANGPIQIEQIAAKYDIVEIDGKMITVREK